MARLVDYEALVLELRGRLLERPSWGRTQLAELLTELEQSHRIDETADAAFLRRFGEHLSDTFMGLVPRPSVTTDPLTPADRETAEAMDAGAASDPPEEGIAWPPQTSSPRTPAFRLDDPTTRRRTPATATT